MIGKQQDKPRRQKIMKKKTDMESIKGVEIEVGRQNIKNKQYRYVKIEKLLNLICYRGPVWKLKLQIFFSFVNEHLSVTIRPIATRYIKIDYSQNQNAK